MAELQNTPFNTFIFKSEHCYISTIRAARTTSFKQRGVYAHECSASLDATGPIKIQILQRGRHFPAAKIHRKGSTRQALSPRQAGLPLMSHIHRCEICLMPNKKKAYA